MEDLVWIYIFESWSVIKYSVKRFLTCGHGQSTSILVGHFGEFTSLFLIRETTIFFSGLFNYIYSTCIACQEEILKKIKFIWHMTKESSN
jgi:hypothetical protein